MKLVEIKKDVFWMALNKGGLIYCKRTQKSSEIIFEDFKGIQIVLYSKDDVDSFGSVSKLDDYLFRFSYKEDNKSKFFLFNCVDNIIVELFYYTEGIPINIFCDKYVIYVNDDFNKVYSDIYCNKFLFELDLDSKFHFGNCIFLLCHFHDDRTKLQCLSAHDGTPLWSWSTKDKYIYEDMGQIKTPTILALQSQLVETKCLLGIFRNGVVALDVATGDVLYEDLNKDFHDCAIFKVYKDHYYQIIYKEYGNPVLRSVNLHTGKENYRKQIKDIAHFTTAENLRNLCSKGISKAYNVINGYLLIMDWEFLYVLNAEDGTLIDYIKVPFLDGVPNGLRTEPMMHDNKIYLHAASTTVSKFDLYVFELD